MATASTGTVSATVHLIMVNASDTGELPLYFNFNSTQPTYKSLNLLHSMHSFGVTKLLDDESLCCGSAGSVKLFEQCSAFVKIVSDEHNVTSLNRFSSWICTELTSVVKQANNKTLDKVIIPCIHVLWNVW